MKVIEDRTASKWETIDNKFISWMVEVQVKQKLIDWSDEWMRTV